MRDDTEMLRFVFELYPYMTLPLYSILSDAVYSDSIDRAYVVRILKDIEDAALVPKARDAVYLLLACKEVLNDISLFIRLWNPKVVSAQDIERTFPRKSRYHRLYLTPLHTDNPSLLKQLLACSFTTRIQLLLLLAILESKTEIALVFFEHLGVSVSSEVKALKSRIWDGIHLQDFYEIVKQIVAEDIPNYEACLTQPEDSLLVYLACMRPEMLDYIIQALEWKTTMGRDELLLQAIDLIPFGFLADIPIYENFHLCIDWSCPANLSLLAVLTRLLELGVDPNQTNLWQTMIWEVLVQDGMSNLPLVFRSLEALIDAGADIEMTFTRSFTAKLNGILKSPTLDANVSERCSAIKPLDIAFTLQDATAFCLLIAKSKDLDGFLQNVTLPSNEGFLVLPEFVQAVRERNPDQIRELWGTRFESPDKALALALKRGQIDVAGEVILRYTTTWKFITLVLQVARYMLTGKACSGCAARQYSRGLEVLQPLMVANISFEEVPEFQLHPLIDEYCDALQITIQNEKLDLLKTLLDFGAGAGAVDGVKSSTYLRLQCMGINPVPLAAKYSLECLKTLIEGGFNINEPTNTVHFRSNSATYCVSETALGNALETGNMKTLSYVLREGADMYAPCNGSPSAIQYSITEGLIDALALFLEIDARCHETALALVAGMPQSPRYIREYVYGYGTAARSSSATKLIEEAKARDLHERIECGSSVTGYVVRGTFNLSNGLVIRSLWTLKSSCGC
ncbi:hypothetical protein AA313_de0204016 [Arthrobotrys entomopaga]|nr:hypothetical protein AA313_de0204016 [Arthrobotrys entomopaga]